MSYTYDTFVPALANMLPVPVSDAGFVQALPSIIDDAEQRIYRELDLIATVVTDASAALVAGNRNFALPGGNAFYVIEQINLISPAGETDPELGTRNPLVPTTKDTLNFLYPGVTGAGLPSMFARITQSTIIVGPWPDGAYQVEVVGTQRPAPLSVTNQSTFLSQYLPDLFFAAAMVFACGYQQNFSAMGDNPQSSETWEAHFQKLLASANIEELRKKFASEGWSSAQPDKIATPPRT